MDYVCVCVCVGTSPPFPRERAGADHPHQRPVVVGRRRNASGGTLLLRITLLRVAAIIGLLLLCVVSLLRVPAGAVALLRVAVAALRVVSSMGGAIGAVSAAKCRLLRGHRGVHLSMCACQLVVALLQTTARGCSV